jgi:WD40 repeat protein
VLHFIHALVHSFHSFHSFLSFISFISFIQLTDTRILAYSWVETKRMATSASPGACIVTYRSITGKASLWDATDNPDSVLGSLVTSGERFQQPAMWSFDLSWGDGSCWGDILMSFNRDNSKLACATCHLGLGLSGAGFQHYLKIFDTSILQPMKKIPVQTNCISLGFTVDSTKLIVLSIQGTASVVDIGTENVLLSWKATTSVMSSKLRMFLSYDGLTIVNCDCTQLVLWDANTCEETSRLSDHELDITCLCVSRAGNVVATGNKDGVINIWDLGARSKAMMIKLEGSVVSGDFSDVGNVFLCQTLAPNRIYVIAMATLAVVAAVSVDASLAGFRFLPSSTKLLCRVSGRTGYDASKYKLVETDSIINSADIQFACFDDWPLHRDECFVCASFPPQMILM